MKGLFDENGAYNYTSFKGKNGIWRLIGVESGITSSPWQCMDEFKSEKGEYKTYKREQVRDQFDNRRIQPIESSEVKLNTETKKKIGRSI